MKHKKDEVALLLEKLNIQLSADSDKEGKQLLKAIMSTFLPAADSLLEMIILHLPSPISAQKYRVETLYEGPMDDEAAIAIRECDPNGPLMVYVSKMVPAPGPSRSRFYAFGRVFAGTVKSGTKVRIQGPNFTPGKKDDLFIKTIEHTMLITGNKVEPVNDMPAGNIVGLLGIDGFLLKSGTLTTLDTAYNFKTMKFSVSPIVQQLVQVKNAQDLPKLLQGLRYLMQSDPLVRISTPESGEHILAGSGELHLKTCLKDLGDYARVPLTISDPTVEYRETVLKKSTEAMSKSPNKHNRLYMNAEPISNKSSVAFDTSKLSLGNDLLANYLADEHGWDKYEARRIWAFSEGPEYATYERDSPNLLVTEASLSKTGEIRDSIVLSFHYVTSSGPLADEPMCGVRFNITDAILHADRIHRGGGQICPPARRVMYASTLLAEPTLLEPVFLVEIQVPETAISGVYSVLNQRRGQVCNEEQRPGSSMFTIKAYLPVTESFGFNADLRQATSGQAFPLSVLDHWQRLSGGSPLDPASEAGGIVQAIRKRKGLKVEIPSVEEVSSPRV